MGTDEPADDDAFDLGLLEAGQPSRTVRSSGRRSISGRRLAIVGGIVVAALVVNAVVQHGDSTKHRPSAIAPRPVVTSTSTPTPVVVGMPQDYQGAQLVEVQAEDLSRPSSSSIRIVPTGTVLTLAVQCPLRMFGSADFEVRLHGQVILGSSCTAPDPDNTLGRIPGAMDASTTVHFERSKVPLNVVVSVTRAGFATMPPAMLIVGVYQPSS